MTYTLLISSLPYHDSLFSAKQPPLSRLKLDQRLQMLEAQDASQLHAIETLLQWHTLPVDSSDEQILNQARQLLHSENRQDNVNEPLYWQNQHLHLKDETLRQIVISRLQLRTVIAALRRRQRGEPPPPVSAPGTENWGFGQWTSMIQRHWHEPAFRLEGIYPWLNRAAELLQTGQTLALERLLLGVVWEQLASAGQGHYFDFVAVVVYVLRWNIINRWTTYNHTAASERFNDLLHSGLGQFNDIFSGRAQS